MRKLALILLSCVILIGIFPGNALAKTEEIFSIEVLNSRTETLSYDTVLIKNEEVFMTPESLANQTGFDISKKEDVIVFSRSTKSVVVDIDASLVIFAGICNRIDIVENEDQLWLSMEVMLHHLNARCLFADGTLIINSSKNTLDEMAAQFMPIVANSYYKKNVYEHSSTENTVLAVIGSWLWDFVQSPVRQLTTVVEKDYSDMFVDMIRADEKSELIYDVFDSADPHISYVNKWIALGEKFPKKVPEFLNKIGDFDAAKKLMSGLETYDDFTDVISMSDLLNDIKYIGIVYDQNYSYANAVKYGFVEAWENYPDNTYSDMYNDAKMVIKACERDKPGFNTVMEAVVPSVLMKILEEKTEGSVAAANPGLWLIKESVVYIMEIAGFNDINDAFGDMQELSKFQNFSYHAFLRSIDKVTTSPMNATEQTILEMKYSALLFLRVAMMYDEALGADTGMIQRAYTEMTKFEDSDILLDDLNYMPEYNIDADEVLDWLKLNSNSQSAADTGLDNTDEGESSLASTGDIIAISAGGDHTVGLKKDGTVVAAGYAGAEKCDVHRWSGITAISAGRNYTVGLKRDGTVIATDVPNGLIFDGHYDVGSWSDVVAISAGIDHTVGLKNDGTVVAVGENEKGQCDVGGWNSIIAVSTGVRHTVGLKSDGTVVIAGWDNHGEYDVSGWRDIVAISAGWDQTVGLKKDGTVVAVGWNDTGQCNVDSWSDIRAISAGNFHTVGLKNDGTVVATGFNGNKECDVGVWSDIVEISAGDAYTVGLKKDGTVVAVGANSSGQCDVDGWSTLESSGEAAAEQGANIETVIIAQSWGNVIGGFKDGCWFTCDEVEKIYKSNVIYLVCDNNIVLDTIRSVKLNELDDVPSYGCTAMKENGVVEERSTFKDYEILFSREPDAMAFSIPAARIPTVRPLNDLSKIQPYVQNLVDSYFGAAVIQADIISAYEVDFDFDGGYETVVNAGNQYSQEDNWTGNQEWYSIAFIIEEDGQVNIINEFHIMGYREDLDTSEINNVIDITGNGVCEIIETWSYYEGAGTIIYIYNEKSTIKVLTYYEGY